MVRYSKETIGIIVILLLTVMVVGSFWAFEVNPDNKATSMKQGDLYCRSSKNCREGLVASVMVLLEASWSFGAQLELGTLICDMERAVGLHTHLEATEDFWIVLALIQEIGMHSFEKKLPTFLSEPVVLDEIDYLVVAGEKNPELTTEPVIPYRVLVEPGLKGSSGEFTNKVEILLSAENGWRQAGFQFVRVSNHHRLEVVLATPTMVDVLCFPLETNGVFSCARGRRAVINWHRWKKGSRSWGKDLAGYRNYLINHEVGHLLGVNHQECPKPGAKAPVMMQQTKSVEDCIPNGFPTRRETAICYKAVRLRHLFTPISELFEHLSSGENPGTI